MKKTLIVFLMATAGLLLAQQYMFPPEPGAFGSYGVDWPTVRGDAQRSSWIRNDRLINPKSVGGNHPAFGLLFKLKLENESRQMDALSEAIIVGQARGGRGFKSMGYLSGVSGNAFGFDYDTGQFFWKADLTGHQTLPAGSPLCPGLGSAVTRPTPLVFSEPTGGGVMAAQGPLSQLPSQFHEGSAVSEPDAGAPNIPYAGTYSFTGAAAGGRGASGGRGAGGGGGGGGRGGGANGVYGLSVDGKIHLMSFQQGFDVNMQPVAFLPPNARTTGFIVVDNTAFVATTNRCGGVENGIWSVSLAGQNAAVKSWKSGFAPVVGAAGFAFTTTKTIVAATGEGAGDYENSIVTLDPATMQVKDYFSLGRVLSSRPVVGRGSDYSDGSTPIHNSPNSSPVVFSLGSREVAAVSGTDGRVYLMDTAAPGGADHMTPLAVSPKYTNFVDDYSPGALAAFRDTAGTHWILAPGPVGVTAFRVTEQGGAVQITTGWTSRPMVSAITPVVMNGVAFAVSSGEFYSADAQVGIAEKVRHSVPAILYALDATTGKELWNSGKSITSFVPHSAGVSASVGQIYLTTWDNTLYTFSLLSER